jgi:hypothetical protein
VAIGPEIRALKPSTREATETQVVAPLLVRAVMVAVKAGNKLEAVWKI